MEYSTRSTQLSKCDFVAEQIKDKVISGVYRSGDQLPPEPALCEMYGVSRITVREALKKLNMMGLVEIKQGKGTFVKSVDLGLFMKPLYQLIDFEEIDVDVIYSAREYIEGGTAYLAAQNRTECELVTLRSILNNLNTAIQVGDIFQVFSLDSAFHREVAKAAHNPILLACLEALDEINTACVKRFNKYLTLLDNCYAEHFAVFTAIEQQNAEKAKEAMVTHAKSSRTVLE